MKLTLHRFDLPCRHPFTIARETTTVQPTLIVELEQDGTSGYGEAVEAPYYAVTIEEMTTALERVRSHIEAFEPDNPTGFWEEIHRLLKGDDPGDSPTTTFPLCALDTAAHDLWGKLRRRPVWRLWRLSLDDNPPSDYTIGIDSIGVMVDKMREFPGWPVYKIKLGTPNDVEIVRELRRHTDAEFRVDANCAWNAEETIRNASELRGLNVEFIEQPLPAGDRDGMLQIHHRCELPIIADESCSAEADVDRCHAEHFDGVNIKLPKCGGLSPARRMIARARQLGMKVMVGCFTESSVGISAVAQLLPLVDYADLDGALLLARDAATGVTIDRGRVVYPDENGCGVRLL